MLGWIGNIFIVAGLWGVGNKYRPAFLASMLGEALWVVNAYLRSDLALMSICVVFFTMAGRAYLKWAE